MIRVLIVDDSSTMRKLLSSTLQSAKDICVIGTAEDPYVARDRIVALRPDVVTLDIEMPRMDGLTFLGKLMKYYPMPVIILSTLTPVGSKTAVRALELGAIDVICKPTSEAQVPLVMARLAEKIRTAASAKIRRRAADDLAMDAPQRLTMLNTAGSPLLAIGASTGGTEAIASLMRVLPENTPPTVIVQHMPENFTASFAARLNEISAMEVREAKEGDVLRPGLALVAAGDFHLLVSTMGKRYMAQVRNGPAVFHQRPSVEVLFNSVAKYAREQAVGVLLTGMGADGARGMLAMRQAGAYTIAQDEASSIVYGMPKVAAELNAADAILALDKIPAAIVRAFKYPRPQTAAR